MLSIIAFAVDLSQSLSFRPIDVAKLVGALGSIRKVLEGGIALSVKVEELDYLPGEGCLPLGKIGGYDRLGLRWGWSLDWCYRRLLGSWWRLDRYWGRLDRYRLHMNDRGNGRHRWRLLQSWTRGRRFFVEPWQVLSLAAWRLGVSCRAAWLRWSAAS